MQSTLDDIVLKRDKIIEIAIKYNVNKVRVFGSVARGEDASDSDIDFLVSCNKGCSLFDIIDMKYALEKLLGKTVDIATERSLSKYLKDRILSEAKDI